MWPEEATRAAGGGGERQGGGGGGGNGNGNGGGGGGGGSVYPVVKAKEGAPTKEEIMGKTKVVPKTSAPEDNVVTLTLTLTLSPNPKP